MTDELWQKSACELAEGMSRRTFSSREVMESVVKRIRAGNGALNAIVFDYTEEALADSQQAMTSFATSLRNCARGFVKREASRFITSMRRARRCCTAVGAWSVPVTSKKTRLVSTSAGSTLTAPLCLTRMAVSSGLARFARRSVCAVTLASAEEDVRVRRRWASQARRSRLRRR